MARPAVFMSRGEVHQAIDRWQATGLVDATTAGRLRADVARHADASARRLSQYVLAFTGAVVLVTAGGVFLDWAWPLLDERSSDADRRCRAPPVRVRVLGAGVE
ncbi:MAG: hypothetical protein AMS19_08185 [Gemmatimonas sp. SG8_23]|nr:MAG: hypothetical protein AMS19_08185 [Gemmatimonas sp. SG8_23]